MNRGSSHVASHLRANWEHLVDPLVRGFLAGVSCGTLLKATDLPALREISLMSSMPFGLSGPSSVMISEHAALRPTFRDVPKDLDTEVSTSPFGQCLKTTWAHAQRARVPDIFARLRCRTASTIVPACVERG